MSLVSEALDLGDATTIQVAQSLCARLFDLRNDDFVDCLALSNLLGDLCSDRDPSDEAWKHSYNSVPKNEEILVLLNPLFGKVDPFREYVLSTIRDDIQGYLAKKFDENDDDDADAQAEARTALVFWDLIVLQSMMIGNPMLQIADLLADIDAVATHEGSSKLGLLALRIIAEAVSRPLEEDFMPKVWHAITIYAQSSDKAIREAGYRIWVRWVSLPDLFLDSMFQDMLGDNAYWELLNKGLTGTSHDCRKYSLHILISSIKALNRDVDVPCMEWDTKDRDFRLLEWNRYFSLIEIVAIDTSFNQAQECLDDFSRILKPSSPIPGLWCVSLLSIGLSSSSDNIRKLIAGVIMDLSDDDIIVLSLYPRFVANDIYRYIMQASLFVTVRDPSRGYVCPHGNRVAQFTAQLIHSACLPRDVDPDENPCTLVLSLIGALLTLLHEQRMSFDPARFFVFKGIADGIHGYNKSKASGESIAACSRTSCARVVLGATELDLMARIGSSTAPHAESELRENAIVAYCLQILQHVDFSVVNLASWIDVVGMFIQRVSYKLDVVLNRLCYNLKSCIPSFEQARPDIKPESIVAYVELLSHLEQYSPERFLHGLSLDEMCFIILASHPDRAVHNMSHLSDFELRFKELVEAEPDVALSSPLVTRALMKKAFHYSWIQPFVDQAPESTVEPSLKKTVFVHQKSVPELLEFLASKNWVEYDAVSKLVTLTAAYKKLSIEWKPKSDEFVSADTRVLPSSQYFSPDLVEMLGEHFASMSHEGRKYAADVLHMLLDSQLHSLDNIAKSFKSIGGALLNMWNAVVTDRLMATERDLHQKLIRTFFHKALITANHTEINIVMEKIADEFVLQSYARRGLLPFLAKQLSWYEGVAWIGQVMIFIYSFLQQDTHLFRLENVVSTILDAELKVSKKDFSYFYFYGDEEVGARIVAADYLFNFAGDYAVNLLEHIWVSPKYHVSEPLKRNDGYEEIVRLRCFQAMLMLERQVNNEAFIQTLLFTHLSPVLLSEPSPLVRVYIEWLVARLLVRRPDWADKVLFYPLQNPTQEPRLIASYLRIGIMVCRQLRKRSLQNSFPADRAIALCEQYLELASALSTSNRATIRHTAVSMACAFVNTIYQDSALREKLGPAASIAERIARNAEQTETFKQYKSGEQTIWDLEADMNLLLICGGVLKKVIDRPVPIIHMHDFIRYLPGKDLSGMDVDAMDVDQETLPQEGQDALHAEDLPPPETVAAPSALASPSPPPSSSMMPHIQTKSGAWNSIIEDLQEGRRKQDERLAKRGDLIVVASLVDKAPNLGGICRVCEVLGAKLLTVPHMDILKDAGFKNVAVTSDQWMPMEQVRPDETKDYLQDMKRQGYTLIGLEQTDNSKPLTPSLSFPKKSLIVLGRERQGIPGDILAELDMCVEIPQAGIIRSMNIQTATAVVVHSYVCQHNQ